MLSGGHSKTGERTWSGFQMSVMVSEVTTLAKQHLAWRCDCNRVCMLGVWFASARLEHIREALAIWQCVQTGQWGRDRTNSFKSKVCQITGRHC